MTPIYNKYLNPNLKETYVSEIVFIKDSQFPIATYKIFYVKFVEHLSTKTGYYTDNNNYLNKLYWDHRNSEDDTNQFLLNRSSNLITGIQPSTTYYSYVKVIKDKKNPQLEGQIMIFKFGEKIHQKIVSAKNINNIFKLKIVVDSTYGYHSYDESNFTNTELNIIVENLDITSEIFFKQINIKAIEREEKLKNLHTEIELKQERYEEYLKLKEEFES